MPESERQAKLARNDTTIERPARKIARFDEDPPAEQRPEPPAGQTEPPADDAETAVAWLSELKLLDDAETARQIVARGVSRGYGAKRIQQMLYEKRVPRKYWEEALASIPDQSGELRDFLAARLGEAPDEKQRKRAIDAALRRGFTWSEVQAALRRLGADEPE